MAGVDDTEGQKPDDEILGDWLDNAGDPGGAPPETIEAVEDVLMERRRQIVFKAHTPNDDDAAYGRHGRERHLAGAAAYLILAAEHPQHAFEALCPEWANQLKVGSPRENYVRAAALLLAQIEMIDRAAAKAGEAG